MSNYTRYNDFHVLVTAKYARRVFLNETNMHVWIIRWEMLGLKDGWSAKQHSCSGTSIPSVDASKPGYVQLCER